MEKIFRASLVEHLEKWLHQEPKKPLFWAPSLQCKNSFSSQELQLEPRGTRAEVVLGALPNRDLSL